jgi:hypothetical protein
MGYIFDKEVDAIKAAVCKTLIMHSNCDVEKEALRRLLHCEHVPFREFPIIDNKEDPTGRDRQMRRWVIQTIQARESVDSLKTILEHVDRHFDLVETNMFWTWGQAEKIDLPQLPKKRLRVVKPAIERDSSEEEEEESE